jgi:predicted Zn-dependent protease
VSDTLGAIYLKKNQPETALPLLRDIVQKDPNNPEFQYHLNYARSGTLAATGAAG